MLWDLKGRKKERKKLFSKNENPCNFCLFSMQTMPKTCLNFIYPFVKWFILSGENNLQTFRHIDNIKKSSTKKPISKHNPSYQTNKQQNKTDTDEEYRSR